MLITPQQIDGDLIELMKAIVFEEYEHLKYDRGVASVKDAFFAGTMPEPYFSYRNIAKLDISQLRKHLQSIDEKLCTGNYPPTVASAYDRRLREIENTFHLLLSAESGDDSLFFEFSKKLYGEPRADFFAYAMQATEEKFREATDVIENTEIMNEIAMWDPLFVKIKNVDTDASIFRTHDIPLIADDGNALTAEDIKERFETAFEGLQINGWRAVIDHPGRRVCFNTNQMTKTVHIPHTHDMLLRTHAMTAQQTNALIAHEIGTHVLRRDRGERGPLGLLGLGLDRYLRGEEGVATYLEQKWDNTATYAGMTGYLAVALALGIDGTPRTFSELFVLLRPYFMVQMIVANQKRGIQETTDYLKKRASSRAWSRCARTYRGTTGASPGCAFTRDLVYLEGNVAIWRLIDDDPSWEERFTLGKYDPANSEHVTLIKSIGLFESV